MNVFSINLEQNVHNYYLQASIHTLLNALAHSEMLPHKPVKHIRKLCKYGDSGCLELSPLEFLKCVL